MFTHSAKIRSPTHITSASFRSRTSSHRTPRLKTCENSAKELPATSLNGQDLKILSTARFSLHEYGTTQRYRVRQKPSLPSLLGSPAWSEYLWCNRWRFTQAAGST